MPLGKVSITFAMFTVAAMFLGKVAVLLWSEGFAASLDGLAAISPLYPVVILQLFFAVLYATFGVLVLRFTGTPYQRFALLFGPGVLAFTFLVGLAQAWASKSPPRTDTIVESIVFMRSITAGLAVYVAVVAFLFVRKRSAGAP